MAFIKKFPTTTFTLPSGDQIVSIDIMKTFVLSKETKEDTSSLKKVAGIYTNKIENLSYELYGNKPSLYWTLIYLNNVDSFEKCPVPQSKFESNLSTKYPGKVYYIKHAIDTSEIQSGDMVVLYTVSDGVQVWKTAGIVKEYDSKFRRVVIHKEYENSGATADFAGSSTFYNTSLEVRRQNADTWEVVPGYEYETGGVTVGRVENETDKILELYQDGLNGRDVSPYQIIEGSEFSSDYDFTATGPTSGTVLYKISSEETLAPPVSNLYFHTLSKEEIRKNTNANCMYYFSMQTAFTLNTFIVNFLSGSFRRGQEITVT